MGFSGKLSWVTLSLVGIVVIILSTRWGIGISPDSVVYIAGARNIAEGRGFSISNPVSSTDPITHFAPLYSAFLSITGLFHGDPLDGAPWVNALLFGVNIFLICALIEKNLRGKSQSTRLWLSVLGGLFLLTSPIMLEIHMMAWSEALFLLLGISGFYMLAMYLENPNIQNFFAAAVLIALTMLTRYAGIVLWVTGAFVIALFLRKPLRSRIVFAFLFGVVSVIPLGVWLARNFITSGDATSREVLFHPIGKSNILQAITTLASWLLIPDTARTWVKLLILFAVGLIFLIAVRSMVKNGVEIPIIVKILGVFIVVYFVFLAFSISFIDANTPPDGRILSPVYFSGLIILIIILGSTSLQFFRYGWVKVFSLAMIALLAITYLVRDGDQTAKYYRSGVGFNSLVWRQSETLSLLETLPKGIPIFSNAPEAIYIHSDRPAGRLPSKFESSNQRTNPEYNSSLAELKAILDAKQGVIVYFNTINIDSLPKADELIQQLALYPIYQASDGAIYGVQSSR